MNQKEEYQSKIGGSSALYANSSKRRQFNVPKIDDAEIDFQGHVAIDHARKLLPLKSENKSYGADESLIPERKLGRYCQDACKQRTESVEATRKHSDTLENLWKKRDVQFDFNRFAKIICMPGAK